eukprot:SAG25_NODE_499_length_7388_cov_11.651393_6_plen_196_part_00
MPLVAEGMVDYDAGFFPLFRMGQPDEQLDAIVGTVQNLTVEQAMALIREKIRGRLPGGPSELRRTFQFFDIDGSGSISLDEFRESLKLKCGLQFEESLLRSIMEKLGAGGQQDELDFNAFSKFVLGSKENDATTFGQHLQRRPESEQMIRAKLRKAWKPLGAAMRRAAAAVCFAPRQPRRLSALASSNLFVDRPL